MIPQSGIRIKGKAAFGLKMGKAYRRTGQYYPYSHFCRLPAPFMAASPPSNPLFFFSYLLIYVWHAVRNVQGEREFSPVFRAKRERVAFYDIGFGTDCVCRTG